MSECSKCGSPYHGEKACPQAAKNRPSFRTRKQMGLKPGELPFKFQASIDPEHDGEAEVSRKQSLMRLNSQRTYMQMGCAAQALQAQQNAVRWLKRLSENMDEDDRGAIAPIVMMAWEVLSRVEALSRDKTGQAVLMEEEIEKARGHAKAVRERLIRMRAEKAKKDREFGVFPLGGPSNQPLFGGSGLVPELKREILSLSGGKG